MQPERIFSVALIFISFTLLYANSHFIFSHLPDNNTHCFDFIVAITLTQSVYSSLYSSSRSILSTIFFLVGFLTVLLRLTALLGCKGFACFANSSSAFKISSHFLRTASRSLFQNCLAVVASIVFSSCSLLVFCLLRSSI